MSSDETTTADDMINGLCCEVCGEYFDDVTAGGEGPGYARTCDACAGDDEDLDDDDSDLDDSGLDDDSDLDDDEWDDDEDSDLDDEDDFDDDSGLDEEDDEI